MIISEEISQISFPNSLSKGWRDPNAHDPTFSALIGSNSSGARESAATISDSYLCSNVGSTFCPAVLDSGACACAVSGLALDSSARPAVGQRLGWAVAATRSDIPGSWSALRTGTCWTCAQLSCRACNIGGSGCKGRTVCFSCLEQLHTENTFLNLVFYLLVYVSIREKERYKSEPKKSLRARAIDHGSDPFGFPTDCWWARALFVWETGPFGLSTGSVPLSLVWFIEPQNCQITFPVLVISAEKEKLVTLNPFTTKSNQPQISSPASPEILHQTVWRTWHFIATQMKDDYTTNSHYLTHTFLFRKVMKMYFLNLGTKGLICGSSRLSSIHWPDVYKSCKYCIV